MEFASNRSGQAGDDNSYRTVFPGRGLVSMSSSVRGSVSWMGLFVWQRRYHRCDFCCRSVWWLWARRTGGLARWGILLSR